MRRARPQHHLEQQSERIQQHGADVGAGSDERPAGRTEEEARERTGADAEAAWLREARDGGGVDNRAGAGVLGETDVAEDLDGFVGAAAGTETRDLTRYDIGEVHGVEGHLCAGLRVDELAFPGGLGADPVRAGEDGEFAAGFGDVGDDNFSMEEEGRGEGQMPWRFLVGDDVAEVVIENVDELIIYNLWGWRGGGRGLVGERASEVS